MGVREDSRAEESWGVQRTCPYWRVLVFPMVLSHRESVLMSVLIDVGEKVPDLPRL